MRPLLLIVVCSLACACSKRSDSTATAPTGPEPAVAEGSAAPPSEGSEPTPQAATEAEGSAAEPDLVMPDPVDAARRTFAAYERLRQSEPGRILWSATEAHGGLSIWYTNGPLGFRFTYTPVEGTPIDTRQLVDPWTARAVHQLPDDSGVRFGWDGTRAWVSDANAVLPASPRGWVLIPYHVVAIPFVLTDEGVSLELVGEQEFEDHTCDLVRATFPPENHTAPVDHYVVLIDRDGGRVRGFRYTETANDGATAAEWFVAVDSYREVDDILFPESYRTFAWTESGPGDLVANTTLTEVTFRPSLLEVAFHAPDGAAVLEGN